MWNPHELDDLKNWFRSSGHAPHDGYRVYNVRSEQWCPGCKEVQLQCKKCKAFFYTIAPSLSRCFLGKLCMACRKEVLTDPVVVCKLRLLGISGEEITSAHIMSEG